MMILKYVSIAALCSVYSVIFIGGYVSSAGLGLSCPDWPLCNGQILPSEEYAIEWVHRFMAALTGALVLSMAALSWRQKGNTRIRLTATLAAIFVIMQITLGFVVIEAKLHALLVAIHLGIGVLLFTTILLTALSAHRIDKEARMETRRTL
jgi:cytochrome c oxidase assembly protein subunit 15